MREPVQRLRGLPGPLPAGEQLLWQGSPEWRALARRAFHVRKVALYFLLLAAWSVASELSGGASIMAAALSALVVVPIALGGLGLLALFAWLTARTTVYTITSRRLVLRFGIALPTTLNLPFSLIEQASVGVHPDGIGDLPVLLVEPNRIAYLVLWPHVRPWKMARSEPMLRAIPEAARVAEILARAMREAATPKHEPAEISQPFAAAA